MCCIHGHFGSVCQVARGDLGPQRSWAGVPRELHLMEQFCYLGRQTYGRFHAPHRQKSGTSQIKAGRRTFTQFHGKLRGHLRVKTEQARSNSIRNRCRLYSAWLPNKEGISR